MGTSQNQIDILLKAVLDAKGFEELKISLQESSKRISDAGKGGEDFTEKLKGMGKEILAAAGIAYGLSEAFAFMKDSFHAAVEEEAGAFRMKAGLQAVAGANDQATESAAAFVNALETQAGIADDILRPALVKLAATTGDVTQAQNLLKLAADASNAGLGDVDGITATLIRFNESGKVSERATDAFSVSLRNQVKVSGDANAALNVLALKYADLAEKNDTVDLQLRRSKISWDNTKEAIGGMFSALGSQLSPALEVAAYGITMVVGGLKLLWTGFKISAEWAQTLAAITIAISKGEFGVAALVFKRTADQTKKAWEDASESVTASLEAIGEAFARNNAATGGKIKTKGGGGDDADEKKRRQEEIDFAKWQEENRVRGLKLREAEAVAVRQWNEQAREDRKKEAALEAADEKRKSAAILRIKKLKAKTKQDELKIERDYWKNMLSTAKAGTAEALEIYASYVQAQKNLDQEEANSKKALTAQKRDAIRAGTQAATTAFGDNKEVALGSALVNTYLSASEALAAPPGPPWSLAYVALALAEGFKSIQGIQKAAPGGGGFDIPEHDMTAYIGGRRWVDDMVRNFTDGVSAGWADGMKGVGGGGGIVNNQSVTNNNQKLTHVNITGLGINPRDDAQARKGARKLQTYLNQLESERTAK